MNVIVFQQAIDSVNKITALACDKDMDRPGIETPLTGYRTINRSQLFSNRIDERPTGDKIIIAETPYIDTVHIKICNCYVN